MKKCKFLNNRITWSRNLTILTVGSAITYMGGATVMYALCYYALDTTKSVLVYSLYLAALQTVRLLTPLVSGTLLDIVSRKKTLYLLNFTASAVFFVFWLISKIGLAQSALTGLCLVLAGTIDGVYRVAFKSFYPLLVKKEETHQANAVLTALETTSNIMIPVGIIVYKLFSIRPVMIISSTFFLLAALIETRIDYNEQYLKKEGNIGAKKYFIDFKDGIKYVHSEKGLEAFIICEIALCIIWGTENAIMLPYCDSIFKNGYLWCCLISGAMMTGEFWGSGLVFFLRISKQKLFKLFTVVTIISFFMESTLLFMPVAIMVIFNLFFGMSSAMTENMRFSAAQLSLPDEKRAKYNGLLSTATTTGLLFGELFVGILSEYISLVKLNTILCGIALLIQIACCFCRREEINKQFLK